MKYLHTTYKLQGSEDKTNQLKIIFQSLERLWQDYNFRDRMAKQVGDKAVRDAFICRITSPVIRQRLLENKILDLQRAYKQAPMLDLAQKNNEACIPPLIHPS